MIFGKLDVKCCKIESKNMYNKISNDIKVYLEKYVKFRIKYKYYRNTYLKGVVYKYGNNKKDSKCYFIYCKR